MSQQEKVPFSLVRYYKGRRLASLIDVILGALLVLLILYAPLPFGSVEYGARAVLQCFAAICFLLWMIKLLFGGNPEELAWFREWHRLETESLQGQPFFQRHAWLTRLLRVFTLGKWPRRYAADNLVEEREETEEDPFLRRFFSFFGYPVRNTGIETIGLIFICLLLFQLIPLPSFLVAAISPSTHDLYSSAARAAETSVRFYPISLDPFVTATRILEYLAYFSIFLTVVNNVRTRRLFWIVLYAIFIAAVFQGVYGLYEFLSGRHHIFSYQKRLGLDSASGTFINRNHFAAYLEMSLPLMIALVVGRVNVLRTFRGNVFVKMAHALETEGSQILMLIFMIVLVAVALIFSLSRSGITFGITSLITFLFFYWKSRKELSRKAYLGLGVSATLALAVWIGLNPVAQRFLHLSENWAEGARLQVWTDTLDIFLHFPSAGTGAGTFSEIFPMYRSFVYNNVYREAHNDYLQLLAESGLLFLFLLVALWEVVARRLKHILAYEIRRLEIIQLGAFCALVSLALHSLTDFSLQIPAIAVQGAVIAGLLFSHYHAEHRESR